MADLSNENRQARKEWQEIFNVMNRKNMQLRILYPASLSFRIEGEIKVFPNKQKLKEFVTTKPALQEILRGILQGPQRTRDITTSMKPTDITMTLNPYLSIITLNVNGLNAPTKRHRVSEWIQKQDPCICCLQETHFRPEDTFRLRVRGWRTIYHDTGSQKKAGVAILRLTRLSIKGCNKR